MIRLLAILAVLLPAVVLAQPASTTMSVRDGNGNMQRLRADQNNDGSLATHLVPEVIRFTPLGCAPWQAVTTSSSVLLSSFPGGIPTGTTLVDIVPSVSVILRDDGSPPTSSGPGIPIAAGAMYPYSGNLTAAQFIAQSLSGTIAVCFFR